MRIFLGCIEVAGYFHRLKAGFDKLQVDADLWHLYRNPSYACSSHPLLRLNHQLFLFFKQYKSTLFVPAVLPALAMMVFIHTLIFIYALFRYDVFILNSHPFFNYAELWLLRLFRKKVIVVFLGTESRPSYISGNLIYNRYSNAGNYNFARCHRNVKEQVRRIRRVERYAHYVINHPPTALLHKKPFIAWLHIGFPQEAHPLTTERQEKSENVRILHAPSNSYSKGTREIETMIASLKEDRYPIEYVRLQNVPNHKVLEAIQQCDIVIDEMYSDIPLGGLGTEAAFARKAVLNGGYYANAIQHDYPATVIPPASFCLPEQMTSTLQILVTDRDKREECANGLYNYVMGSWTDVLIAEKYLLLINDQVPQEWFFDPMRIRHIHGYGISEALLAQFLKGYISQNGEAGLFLQDKPLLVQQFLQMIAKNENQGIKSS